MFGLFLIIRWLLISMHNLYIIFIEYICHIIFIYSSVDRLSMLIPQADYINKAAIADFSVVCWLSFFEIYSQVVN